MTVVSLQFAFQSPRSGKFVSDKTFQDFVATVAGSFQSPRSGKFVSDFTTGKIPARSDSLIVSIP